MKREYAICERGENILAEVWLIKTASCRYILHGSILTARLCGTNLSLLENVCGTSLVKLCTSNRFRLHFLYSEVSSLWPHHFTMFHPPTQVYRSTLICTPTLSMSLLMSLGNMLNYCDVSLKQICDAVLMFTSLALNNCAFLKMQWAHLALHHCRSNDAH